nr:unnamed protein product [Digitaria exilis]CAB3489842.1 unnamed protein product [Digitaria exilis]
MDERRERRQRPPMPATSPYQTLARPQSPASSSPRQDLAQPTSPASSPRQEGAAVSGGSRERGRGVRD